MAQPYVGEIRMFAGNFAPAGWFFCAGQQLPISEFETLFQLIGTTYGGDGESNFNVPDLQGRIPLHLGAGFSLGEEGGAEEITLTTQQIPIHTHPLLASTAPGSAANPAGQVLAESGSSNLYRPPPTSAPMAPQSVGPVGGSQPHTNLMPYLCINYIISPYGIFPSPT
jgi:microcystin-dependent protein